MERFEFFPAEQVDGEQVDQTGGETAVDTQIEVDLICGGVGFDDGPADRERWLREAREKQKKDGKED